MLEEDISLALEAGDVYIVGQLLVQKLNEDLLFKRTNSTIALISKYSNFLNENEVFYFSFCSYLFQDDDSQLETLLKQICRYKNKKEIINKSTLSKCLMILNGKTKLTAFQKSVSYLLKLILNVEEIPSLRALEVIVLFRNNVFILLEIAKIIDKEISEKLSTYIFKSIQFDYSFLSSRHPFSKKVYDLNKKSISVIDNEYPEDMKDKSHVGLYELAVDDREQINTFIPSSKQPIIPVALKTDFQDIIESGEGDLTSYFELLNSMELYDFAIDLINDFDPPEAEEKKILAYYHEYFNQRKAK